MTGGELDIYNTSQSGRGPFVGDRDVSGADCTLATGMSMQLAFGSAAILAGRRPENERSRTWKS